MIVLGIDPSLTGTGIAIVDTEDRLVVETLTLATSGKADARLTARHDRIAHLAERRIGDIALGVHGAGRGGADLVVIEAPAYDSRVGHQHDRSGLWWLIVHRLYVLGIPVASVTTGGLKKYATGSGTAKKDTVLLAVARRYPHVDVSNNNEADALVLAAMGARWAGQPIDDMPKAHTDALAKVEWPAEVTAA